MTDDVIAMRPRMMSVAYRMLGSVADAEDADQAAAEVQASISGILAGMRLLPSLADPPA